MTPREVYLIGGGLSPFRRSRSDGTLPDWMSEAALAAIGDAVVDPEQIDHSVIAYESEILARQVTLGQVVSDQLGLTPKPSVRVEAGGGTGGAALRTAYAHIAGGLADSVLVIGAEAAGREIGSDTVRSVYALSGDVDFEMGAGGSFLIYYAMMMAAHMQTYGTTEAQMAHVSVRNHRNALANTHAAMAMELTICDVLNSPVMVAPYKRLDCSVLADGAAAVLLATPQWARDHAQAWIDRPRVRFTGTGCGTDRVRLGDRPTLTAFRAKEYAARNAYAMAGITDPLRQIDVAEVCDSYTGAELMSLEALGFAPPGESGPMTAAGVFDSGGKLPVNPSGGLLGMGGPPGAIGIAQAVEILTQLRGEAPASRQVLGARRGLTDIHGGTASYAAVAVFERID